MDNKIETQIKETIEQVENWSDMMLRLANKTKNLEEERDKKLNILLKNR